MKNTPSGSRAATGGVGVLREASEKDLSQAEADEAAGRPFRVTVEGGRLECTFRLRPALAPAIGAVWLVIWGTGSALFTAHLAAQPTPFMVYTVVMLWLAWAAVALAVPTFFMREERLILDAGGLFLERSTPIGHRVRTIPRWELKGFAAQASHAVTFQYSIQIQSIGLPTDFASHLNRLDDCEWLASRLNRHLDLVRAQSRSEAPNDCPSDCRWQAREDMGELIFIRRGESGWRWLLAQPLVLGIYSLFVVFPAWLCWSQWTRLQNGPGAVSDWGLWIGSVALLALFGGFGVAGGLASLLSPLRIRIWRIGEDLVEFANGWGVVRYRRTYATRGLAGFRVEIHDPYNLPPVKPGSTDPEDRPPARPGSQIVFVDFNQKKVCAIKRLTEGEANWMAHFLAEKRLFGSPKT